MRHPKKRKANIPRRVVLVLVKDIVGEFMSPFHVPVIFAIVFIITHTANDVSMQLFPDPSTESTARERIADEDEVFCGRDEGKGFADCAWWDFTFVGCIDEVSVGVFVGGEEIGELVR